MSTLEAKYIACSEASREGRWLLQLFQDIEHKDENKPLPILCDNKGALAHIINGVIKSRTTHIDVCYHNSRDLHKYAIVNYSWILTQENVADIFMKALGRQKHEKFAKAIGLV
jgi:DNA repair protein RadC